MGADHTRVFIAFFSVDLVVQRRSCEGRRSNSRMMQQHDNNQPFLQIPVSSWDAGSGYGSGGDDPFAEEDRIDEESAQINIVIKRIAERPSTYDPMQNNSRTSKNRIIQQGAGSIQFNDRLTHKNYRAQQFVAIDADWQRGERERLAQELAKKRTASEPLFSWQQPQPEILVQRKTSRLPTSIPGRRPKRHEKIQARTVRKNSMFQLCNTTDRRPASLGQLQHPSQSHVDMHRPKTAEIDFQRHGETELWIGDPLYPKFLPLSSTAPNELFERPKTGCQANRSVKPSTRTGRSMQRAKSSTSLPRSNTHNDSFSPVKVRARRETPSLVNKDRQELNKVMDMAPTIGTKKKYGLKKERRKTYAESKYCNFVADVSKVDISSCIDGIQGRNAVPGKGTGLLRGRLQPHGRITVGNRIAGRQNLYDKIFDELTIKPAEKREPK